MKPKDNASELAHTHLFSLPVNDPKRPKLSDQYPYSPEKLARKTRQFLSLSPEYADGANTAFWRRVNDTSQRLPSLRTRQLQCQPFESGRNTLPGMERFAHGPKP